MTLEELQKQNEELKAKLDKIKDPDAILAKNKELLDSLAAEKQAKKDLEDKLAREAEEKKKLEEKSLAEKGEYKTLYENEKKAREEREKALQAKEQEAENFKKKDAVKAELKKLGLKDERMDLALSMVNPSDIVYNKELNVFSGHDVLAQKVKNLSPEWFGSGARASYDGGGAPAITPKTAEELSKLSGKEFEQAYKATIGKV